MTIGDRLPILLVAGAAALILLSVPILVVTGRIWKFGLKPLEKRFEGLDLHDLPQSGDVCFVYHTYRGFLFWGVQTEHRVAAAPEDAKLLLARLLRFNLTWGMLCIGQLFVPWLAIGNFYAQKRSIEKQIRELAFGCGPDCK